MARGFGRVALSVDLGHRAIGVAFGEGPEVGAVGGFDGRGVAFELGSGAAFADEDE